MNKIDLVARLVASGHKIISEQRNGKDAGWIIRLRTGAIVNCCDNGNVSFQGIDQGIDLIDFPEVDSWSRYQDGSQERVEIALRNLVRAVAAGLNYEYMVDRADADFIAGLMTGELRWLVNTIVLQRIIAAELGPGGIGTDDEP